MAESILRLKVSSAEYDNKLKQAAQGLTRYIDQCRKVGGTLEVVEKETLEYVRSLGKMETTSRTATGRLNEMKKTFVDLSVQYNSLTDAEKSAPFGRGIAESLDQLKPRILNAKQELEDINKSLGDMKMPDVKGGGFLSGIGDKMSGMLQVFGGNMLTKGVSMLTSELTGSVQESIELARQGEGIRMAFERLNNPGLLDSLKEATHGTVSEIELMQQAIKFENFNLPVEDLANYLAFAQQKAKDTGESIDFLVTSIVNGLGRQSKQILDNLGISASELTSRMNEGATMTQAVSDIIREEMAKAGDYVETAADRAARAAADTKNKMEELGRSAMPVAEEFASAWTEIRNGAMTLVLPVLKILADSIRDIREILGGEWDMPTLKPGVQNAAEGSNIDDNGNFIRKPSNGNWAGFNAQTGQYNNAITAIQDVVVTGNAPAKKKGRSGRVSSANMPSIDDFNKQLFKSMSGDDLKQEIPHFSVFETFKDQAKFDPENILGSKDAWEKYKDTITGSIGSIGESMSNLTEWTPNFDPFLKKQKEMTKAAKQQQMAFNMGAEAAANLGAAFASMEDPAAKAAGTVISAIANIALGFGMAVAQASSMGPWAWLAYVAAGTAALATTISTVHSLTGYAEGGIIKGNSYSGDNIGGMVDGGAGGFVGLNAGEIVLNKSQQSALAGQLQGNGINGINLSGRIKGTDIILSVDRSLQLQGKQLLTWG